VRPAATWRLAASVLLLGAYGLRAAGGIRGGWELDRGHLLRNMGDYTTAAPRLERGAVGLNAARALIMAGEVRLDQWEKQVRRGGPLGADPQELRRAAEDFLTCRCRAPAARRAWKGLAEVYDAIEWIGRERRSEEGRPRPGGGWERVGRPGRIAVGLLRETVEGTPTWGAVHDRLALTLWNYGLEDEARVAVRAAARVLPLYYHHPFHRIPELPPWVDLEFAKASREVLGQVPLFPRTPHLIDLGKLERRLGASDRAIADLEEAVAAGGDDLRVAEGRFHLGLALVAAGRFEEGRVHLEAAREHPVFRPSALRSLANLAARQGDSGVALEHLRQLRRENPRELWPCLEFAEVAVRAGEWPAALEALRWAKLKHPRDPRPYVELAEVHLAMDDLVAATSVVDELAQALGEGAPDLGRLRREIASRGRSPRRP
jgi:tetratricopeptide (TPR) repeat protein